jgi:predicted GNAT family acetyltransferase
MLVDHRKDGIMNIRKIRKNEINQLTELYFHYIPEENLPPIHPKKMEKIWNQIESNPCINYFVLEIEEKIVASCILTITPSFIRGGDGFGLIEHVVTNKNFRRKGFGESIVKHSLNYAWENGCTEVMLLSGSQNENAHKMYEKIGFNKYRKTGFIIYRPD